MSTDVFRETLSISNRRASTTDALHRLPTSLDRYPSLKKLVAERLEKNINDDFKNISYYSSSCDEGRVAGIASTKKMEMKETYTEKKKNLDVKTSMNCQEILAQEATLCLGSIVVDDRQHVTYFLEDLKRAREERRNRLLKSCKAFSA